MKLSQAWCIGRDLWELFRTAYVPTFVTRKQCRRRRSSGLALRTLWVVTIWQENRKICVFWVSRLLHLELGKLMSNVAHVLFPLPIRLALLFIQRRLDRDIFLKHHPYKFLFWEWGRGSKSVLSVASLKLSTFWCVYEVAKFKQLFHARALPKGICILCMSQQFPVLAAHLGHELLWTARCLVSNILQRHGCKHFFVCGQPLACEIKEKWEKRSFAFYFCFMSQVMMNILAQEVQQTCTCNKIKLLRRISLHLR